MALERTISLRDAGLRLAQLLNSSEKVASGKLLSLLKARQIEAGFQFPGTTARWINNSHIILGYDQQRQVPGDPIFR